MKSDSEVTAGVPTGEKTGKTVVTNRAGHQRCRSTYTPKKQFIITVQLDGLPFSCAKQL